MRTPEVRKKGAAAPARENSTPVQRDLSSVDVVVVRKQSAVERFGSDEDRHKRAHDSLLEVIDTLRTALKEMGHTYQVLTLDELQSSGLAFFKPSVSLMAAERPEHLLNPRARLVISVGGDGTLLHASHYLGGDVSLLGVNAFPKTSVGHLCLARPTNLRDILARIGDHTLAPRLVHRLMLTFLAGPERNRTRRPLPLALNDILVCSAHPAATSKYHLTVLQTDERESAKISAHQSTPIHAKGLEHAGLDTAKTSQVLNEEHVCSGAWIATAAGSTAAISSYGLQRLPLGSSDFLFAAREPYFRPQNFSVLDRAAFRGGRHQLQITSRMASGLVAVDGADFTDAFDQGDTVCISMEPQAGIQLYV